MKLHAAFLATLLAAGTSIAIAQTSGQSTAPPSGDDQMQTQQPAPGQKSQMEAGDEIAGQVSNEISKDTAIGGIVHVKVSGNKLILDGTVDNKKAKTHAEQIATPYATSNNLKLVDRITATDD